MGALTIAAIEESLREFEYSINWRTLRYGFGYHLAARIGSGFMYEGVKPFEAYPNPRRINWKQTDKLELGEPLVNVFREEHEIDVCFIADLSRSMYFGAPAAKIGRLAKVAALIAYAVRKSRDRFGFIGVTDEIEELLYRPFGVLARHEPLAIAERILAFKPQSAGMSAFADSRTLLPRTTSLVFVGSDFFPQKDFMPTLEAMVETHDVVPLVFRDLWEETLPVDGGYARFRDAESDSDVTVHLGAREAKMLEERIREENRLLGVEFSRFGIEPMWFRQGKDEIETISEYFASRE